MTVTKEKMLPVSGERLPANHLLLNILLHSPVAIALIEGPEYKYEFTNPLFDQLVGRRGLTGTAAIPDLIHIGIPAAGTVLDQISRTCRAHEVREMLVLKESGQAGVQINKYYNLQINAVNEPATRFFRLWIHATDVTELVEARQKWRESESRQALAAEAGQTGSVELNPETGERLQQAELRANHPLFEKMVEGVQDYAIIQLDNVGNVIRWNQGAKKIAGYSENEVLGKNFRIFYSPEDRLARLPEQLLSRALAEGRAENQGWGLRRDGSRFWAKSVINALHNDQKKVMGFVQIVHDMTEKVLSEEKMKEYAEQLELRNRELEEFAYIASHDLQEPMRKIQTFIQLIDHDSHNPEGTQRYLAKIKSAAQRMSTLVKSVLDYSRLTNIEELFEQTDLNQVFRLVTDDFELLIKEKKAVVSAGELPVIRGIPLQMQQLFSNFISNSLKFCRTRPEVRVSSRLMSAEEMLKVSPLCTSGCWEIEFADNGIGFDEKYSEEIFTMFRRLNSTADYAGTGIGLALCKKIADNHNGFLRAEGSSGNGARFRVYIPAIRR